jgi:3-dehydroquinate synthase
VDTAYSACAGLLPHAEAARAVAALRALGLPTTHELLADHAALAAGLDEFREHLGGRLTITLLRGIGSPVDVHDLDRRTLAEAIAAVR